MSKITSQKVAPAATTDPCGINQLSKLTRRWLREMEVYQPQDLLSQQNFGWNSWCLRSRGTCALEIIDWAASYDVQAGPSATWLKVLRKAATEQQPPDATGCCGGSRIP